jgi:hypothetical protein
MVYRRNKYLSRTALRFVEPRNDYCLGIRVIENARKSNTS